MYLGVCNRSAVRLRGNHWDGLLLPISAFEAEVLTKWIINICYARVVHSLAGPDSMPWECYEYICYERTESLLHE